MLMGTAIRFGALRVVLSGVSVIKKSTALALNFAKPLPDPMASKIMGFPVL